MSKKNGWIPLDKNLSQYLPHNRPYTRVEAMFSYTKDLDNNKEGTIQGYSNQWQWSRDKVRKFIIEIKETSGFPKKHQKNSKKTVKKHPIHYIDKALWDIKNSKKTVKKHQKNTSYNPNPNPNPKKNKIRDIRERFATHFLFTKDVFRTEDEILKNSHSRIYHSKIIKMLNIVKSDYPILNELKEPITYTEIHKLLADELGSKNILAIFSEMANYADIKKKISVNLTVRNWLRRKIK